MSEENVAIVRRLFESFARGDNQWPFTVYRHDIVWEPVQVAGIQPVYHGHDGVRAFWRDWLEAFADARFEVERYVDAGDQVVVLLSHRETGRESGTPVEFGPYAQLWAFRDGLVAAMRIHRDPNEGLRAAGIDPATLDH